MSGDVDYYDVQSMIRDAVAELRGDLRDEVRELDEKIAYERRTRSDEIESLWRVVNSRTEHLV